MSARVDRNLGAARFGTGRRCIFNCATPCAAGCTPRAHLGVGATSVYALGSDQRFSYCLYVPEAHDREDATYPLVVAVHGTERRPHTYRDAFAEFAEQHRCVVLAPLFPCGIHERGELHNYKFLAFHEIRYDEVLLAMVDEVAEMYRIETERFLLHGFSGGGQFANRFLFVHPERLRAVSIGAPGWPTLPDLGREWWVGVRDLERHFGRALDLEALRRVPVLIAVGAEDTDNWDVLLPEGSRYWMAGANDCGATRVERMRTLRDALRAHGVEVEHVEVPGVGHAGTPLFPAVQAFFARVLAR